MYGDNKLSQCTQNAAKLIADLAPDIVGIQEGDKIAIPNVVNHIMSIVDSKLYDYKLVGNEPIFTIYNHSTMGEAKQFFHFHNMDEVIRSVQAIYFPETHLVFINVWCNHPEQFELKCTDMMKSIQNLPYESSFDTFFGTHQKHEIDRVIVTVDSNDGSGLCQSTKFDIMGFRLQVPNNKELKTCCDDTGFIYTGDYIFDSYSWQKPDQNKEYKMQETVLMSDHYPVIFSDL